MSIFKIIIESVGSIIETLRPVIEVLRPVIEAVRKNPISSVRYCLRIISADFKYRSAIVSDSSELLRQIKLPVISFATECFKLRNDRNETLEQLNADFLAELVNANTLIVNPNGEITEKDPSVLVIEEKVLKDIYALEVDRGKSDLISQTFHLASCLLEEIQPSLEEFGRKFLEKVEIRNNRFFEIHAQYVAQCSVSNQVPPIHEEGICPNQEQDNDEDQEQDNDEDQEQDNDEVNEEDDVQNDILVIPPPPPTLFNNIVT